MSSLDILGLTATALIVMVMAGTVRLAAKKRTHKRAIQQQKNEQEAFESRLATARLAQEQCEFMALITRVHHCDRSAVAALQSELWVIYIEQDAERQRLAASAIDYCELMLAGYAAKDMLIGIDVLETDAPISERIERLDQLIMHLYRVSEEWRRWIYVTHGISVAVLEEELEKWEGAYLAELVEQALSGDLVAMREAVRRHTEDEDAEPDYFPAGWNQAVLLHYGYTAEPWMWDLSELAIVRQPMGLAMLAGQVLVYDGGTWLNRLPLHVVGWAAIVLSHGTEAREQVGDHVWAQLMLVVAHHQQVGDDM